MARTKKSATYAALMICQNVTSNLPHQRTLSFPCKLVRPNASQTLMLLGSLAGKNRKILSRKQGPGPAAATEVLTNSKQDAQHTKTQESHLN